MDKLVVRGRKRLTGEVTISGAKNAAVAVIPAAVMATGVSVLENLPSIEDVRNICHTIQEMGGKCRFLDKHTLAPSGGGSRRSPCRRASVRRV